MENETNLAARGGPGGNLGHHRRAGSGGRSGGPPPGRRHRRGSNPRLSRPPRPNPIPPPWRRDWCRSWRTDSYRERQAATEALWDMGDDALEVLEEAAKSDDPEVAYRARILVQRGAHGKSLRERTRPVIDLVQRYFKSSATGKKGIFEQLEEKEAYVQMLRLYRFENRPGGARSVRRGAQQGRASRRARPAQRGAASRRQWTCSASLPPPIRTAGRLATLLRVQGKLEKELERTAEALKLNPDGSLVRKADQMDVAALRLALLRGPRGCGRGAAAGGEDGPSRSRVEPGPLRRRSDFPT